MKHKTKKAASKRFVVTSKGTVRRRATKQAHFNSRATGEEGRRKHGYINVEPSDMVRMEHLLPYRD